MGTVDVRVCLRRRALVSHKLPVKLKGSADPSPGEAWAREVTLPS